MPEIDPKKDSIIFQQIDLDFYEGICPWNQDILSLPLLISSILNDVKGPPMKEALTSSLKEPIFRIYGVNEAGNSILAHLYGYVPYLYCAAPTNCKESELRKYADALNSACKNDDRQKEQPERYVLGIKLETKENIYGFHGNIIYINII